jgi:hypothetical protein
MRFCGSAALVEVARRLPRHGPPNRNGYATADIVSETRTQVLQAIPTCGLVWFPRPARNPPAARLPMPQIRKPARENVASR